MTEEARRDLIILFNDAMCTQLVESGRAQECRRAGNPEGAARHEQNRNYFAGVASGVRMAAKAAGMIICYNEEKGAFEIV